MGDVYWVGGAVAVAQVVAIQLTAYDSATTYKITIGGSNGAPSVVISVAGTGGTVNTTATALAAAWNASTHPYCTGITALATTDTVTLTADVAGVPFVVTSSKSGGTGTIAAASTTTANAGPNDWSTAANWSGAAVPANSDNVYLRNSSIPILWGLAQSGITPSLLVVERTYTGRLGLALGTFAGSGGTIASSSVPEYRQSYLAIGAAVVRIGESYGASNAQGSPLVKIDTGTTANAALTVYSAGNSGDGSPSVFLKASHSGATCKVYDGVAAICWEVPGETGQLSEVDVYVGGSPRIFIGSGVTLATLFQEGGDGVTKCLPTTVKVEDGATLTFANPATGTVTTLEKRGEIFHEGVAFAVTNFKG